MGSTGIGASVLRKEDRRFITHENIVMPATLQAVWRAARASH